ncbi:hypothetical protein [Rhodospirillum sp. A1_3_36]|uniref:hypothetical protein n=1 Tax=Rhodospirillum sp. A1_3_36 TaxID=3391666 RepID=UPI0039A50430
MDHGYNRGGRNDLAPHREPHRPLSGSKIGQPAAIVQTLFDTQLLGYRLEDIWTFFRSSERDRAMRLGLSGFLLRQGRRVIRVLEGSKNAMESARDEILVEERELEHAQSMHLESWLPSSPLFKGRALQVIEPDEAAFRDLLSSVELRFKSVPSEPEALCHLIAGLYLTSASDRLPL